MNILFYKLKFLKFLLNLITNKNINRFRIRFVGVDLKYNNLDVLIFSVFFVT
jgi:hypothetical protein